MYQELVHLIASDFLQQLICQYSHIPPPLLLTCILPHSPPNNKGLERHLGLLERIDGLDAAVHLPVVQVFRQELITTQRLGRCQKQ